MLAYNDASSGNETHQKVWNERSNNHHETLNDRDREEYVETEESPVREPWTELHHVVSDTPCDARNRDQERERRDVVRYNINRNAVVTTQSLFVEHFHLFDERWKPSNGHESHETSNESTTRNPSQDRCVAVPYIVKDGPNTDGYNNVDHNS